MPDTTNAGRSLRIVMTPRLMQSVGVPLVLYKPSAIVVTRKGLCSVIAWPAAVRSPSGATTVTSPTLRSASARRLSPKECTPSSLDTRILGLEDMREAGCGPTVLAAYSVYTKKTAEATDLAASARYVAKSETSSTRGISKPR